MAKWRPMGQTAEQAGALYEGVPDWLATGLWAWIEPHIHIHTGRFQPDPHTQLVDKFERLRHTRIPVTRYFEDGGMESLIASWDAEGDVLPFIDFLIHELAEGNLVSELAELEKILLEGGSAWKVGMRDGYVGLERRVPLGVQEAAERVMSSAGNAGESLSEAWHAAFGMNPDPWKAYSKAVIAVEDAALPTVSPEDRDRTLGKAIGAIRDQGWELPTPKPDERTPTSEVLRHMLGMLWYGHGERHGGRVDPNTKISREDAEVAVLLAVPLVQWFESGAAKRPAKDIAL